VLAVVGQKVVWVERAEALGKVEIAAETEEPRPLDTKELAGQVAAPAELALLRRPEREAWEQTAAVAARPLG